MFDSSRPLMEQFREAEQKQKLEYNRQLVEAGDRALQRLRVIVQEAKALRSHLDEMIEITSTMQLRKVDVKPKDAAIKRAVNSMEKLENEIDTLAHATGFLQNLRMETGET